MYMHVHILHAHDITALFSTSVCTAEKSLPQLLEHEACPPVCPPWTHKTFNTLRVELATLYAYRYVTHMHIHG